MTAAKPQTARFLAMTALNQSEKAPKKDYAAAILNKLLGQTTQKQRATDLVFGSIRNRIAIDTVISRLADCPVERMPVKLRNIIRIGAYELIYNPATVEYAIVNEAVENAKALAGKKQAGFVNAVLRQITRHIRNRQVPLDDAETQNTLPQTLSAGCEFDSHVLPEPKLSPADYFSEAFSLPKWLVTQWMARFGAESTRQICFACNRRPGLYIRPNILRTTPEQLAEKFRQADINFEITAESMMKIQSPRAVTEMPGFDEGLFSVQDVTASKAVRILNPQPDWTILDLCAAPGGKTVQLAEFTGDKAKIIATDIDSRRLEKVNENVIRLGINSVRVVAYEQLEQFGPFDCVLLDVPCSNTGVLARRPEVRYRITPQAVAQLAKIQMHLLDTAAKMIKPQAKICYSTCSIQSDENGGLVKEFLQKNHTFELEAEELILPSAEDFGRDGGYAAVITDTK